MTMRKVTVQLTVKLEILADEGADISNLLDEMDYNFTIVEDGQVVDSTIEDYQITDSR